MVPYADMLNHDEPRQIKFYYDEIRKGFTMRALKSFKLGEQLYNTYGKDFDTMKLFLNYGFIMQKKEGQ